MVKDYVDLLLPQIGQKAKLPALIIIVVPSKVLIPALQVLRQYLTEQGKTVQDAVRDSLTKIESGEWGERSSPLRPGLNSANSREAASMLAHTTLP